MPTRIDIPEEGVTVTATCGRCHEPLNRADGWMSWRCDNDACPTRLIPMFEDARFVDDGGTVWIPSEDEEGGWIDVVDDAR